MDLIRIQGVSIAYLVSTAVSSRIHIIAGNLLDTGCPLYRVECREKRKRSPSPEPAPRVTPPSAPSFSIHPPTPPSFPPSSYPASSGRPSPSLAKPSHSLSKPSLPPPSSLASHTSFSSPLPAPATPNNRLENKCIKKNVLADNVEDYVCLRIMIHHYSKIRVLQEGIH